MTHSLVLKGTGNRGPRNRWSYEAKARVVKAKTSGKKAVEAIAEVVEEFGLELKPSYKTVVGAHSHLYRFRKDLNAVLGNSSHRSHDEVAAICARLGILAKADESTAEAA